MWGNQFPGVWADSFNQLSLVSYLDLSSNPITFLEPGAFNGMNGLISVALYNTQLTSIQQGVFVPALTSLQYIYIQHCSITYIAPSAFNVPTLAYL